MVFSVEDELGALAVEREIDHVVDIDRFFCCAPICAWCEFKFSGIGVFAVLDCLVERFDIVLGISRKPEVGCLHDRRLLLREDDFEVLCSCWKVQVALELSCFSEIGKNTGSGLRVILKSVKVALTFL